MKYMISRTSVWDSEVPSCEEAYKDSYVRVDIRSVDDPKKIHVNNGTDGDWYITGRNHRIIDGRIARDFDDIAWFVDINSLEELNNFSMKYGSVIIIVSRFLSPSIEIYDDYRE